ncbi:MAG: hypothetical protein JW889_06070 [Verrucomicrobia bacterium]|nr:hypothetical protein [Verrucomicrobiota bacterium]
MDRELENLRRAVSRVERGRGRRYPTPLRERVIRWAGARREHGARWHQLSSELGISAESLRRWVLLEAPAAPALVPVEVVGQDREGSAADRPLRLVTRAGHRIEGLSLADAIELVRVLG